MRILSFVGFFAGNADQVVVTGAPRFIAGPAAFAPLPGAGTQPLGSSGLPWLHS